jgi:hypothetical protein
VCVGDVNERSSVDVCMETELTRWNDGNPWMATNDVVVGCCNIFCFFVFVVRLVRVSFLL